MKLCLAKMLFYSAAWAAVLPIALAAASAAGSDLSNWRVVQIPGATNVQPAGINASGVVAGTYWTATGVGGNSRIHGFIRQSNGSITTVDVNAVAGTVITGINDQGQVCGSSGSNGFIRDSDGTLTIVSVPPSGGYPTSLYGINNLGQVIGVGNVYFLRNPDGSFVKLTFPQVSAVPVSLNDSGAMAGFYDDAGTTRGFVFGTDGSFTPIDVPDAPTAAASGINNLGQVVGTYSVIGTDPNHPNITQLRGFIRDTDGTITLVDAPYFGSTQLNGISSTGRIAASFSRNGDGLPPNIGLVRKCLLCP